jgi:hypothetical protein
VIFLRVLRVRLIALIVECVFGGAGHVRLANLVQRIAIRAASGPLAEVVIFGRKGVAQDGQMGPLKRAERDWSRLSIEASIE